MSKWNPSGNPDLDEINKTVDPYLSLFSLVREWRSLHNSLLDGIFLTLDAELTRDKVEAKERDVLRQVKYFRDRVRAEHGREGEGIFRSSQEENEGPVGPTYSLNMAQITEREIKEFKYYLPTIEVLCTLGLKPKHWKQLSEIVGFDITPDSSTTLREMLSHNLEPYTDKFELISAAASKEHSLEKAMLEMLDDWRPLSFNLLPHRDTGVFLLSDTDGITTRLGDQLVKIQTMKSSRFIEPFLGQIASWEEKLLIFQSTLEEWQKVQSQWLYLEPIFSSQEISLQMPEEAKMFLQVDKHWKDIMKDVVKNPSVLHTIELSGLLDKLKSSNGCLDKVVKGIDNYLEKKRLFFPRFFFVSNDEILEVLSVRKDPNGIQPHLKKCFEGICKLQFEPNLDISAIISEDGEKVTLSRHVPTSGAAVEEWLQQLQEAMFLSIHDLLHKSLISYSQVPRLKWLKEWPGQIILAVDQIFWTQGAHEAIRSQPVGLNKFRDQLTSQLVETVELLRGELTTVKRTTLVAMLTLDVHARDIITNLVERNINSEKDFDWQNQLRYYWEENQCIVRMMSTELVYGSEYLGNGARLVITPLTDRCYRTLFSAFSFKLCGAPQGPAGTGKTETIKDLAKALAIQCVVINCSEMLDYIAMGKIFMGIAGAGVWSCFDEFNRIDVEVLAVIGQQILCIHKALLAHCTTFVFEGTTLNLNPSCFINFTFNPGYAGRTKLPGILKELSRPIAMMVPDYALILEIYLYSHGILNANIFAAKITNLYRLCSEQLSSQDHYDFGLRAVKAVIRAVGNLKLKFPSEDENVLVLKSIMNTELSKFISQDIPLFEGIVSDLFPGVNFPKVDHTAFTDAIREICKRKNLQATEFFIQKILQTYEVMLLRHGFMIIGSPFAGKSRVLDVLADTLTLLNEREELGEFKTSYRCINPKSMEPELLYGQMDHVTTEWSDGVATNIFREFASAQNDDRKWIVFDGPVDAIWIESLNTVLDDNKKLCLANGEVIGLSKSMSVIFETEDLCVASPATVSRNGMVYVDTALMGWKPLFLSWLCELPNYLKEETSLITALFEWSLPPLFSHIRKDLKEHIATQDVQLCVAAMRLFSMLFEDAMRGETAVQDNTGYVKNWIVSGFIFTIIWSLGAACDSDSKDTFDVFFRHLLTGKLEDYPLPKIVGEIEIPLPNGGSVFDVMFSMHGRGRWVPWIELIRNEKVEIKNKNLSELLIPTIDTARYTYLMDLFIRYKFPLLFVGHTSTGKTTFVMDKLINGLDRDLFVPLTIQFSKHTQANQVQDTVLSKVECRKKGVYGPSLGKKLLIFVDDLNMPAKEKYGAQPPIELLRHWMDYKSCYDKKDTSRINLVDTQLICAMGIPGGGRNQISMRFYRHFSICSMNTFSDETITQIFSTIISVSLMERNFPADFLTIGSQVVAATLDLYKSAIANLLPTPTKCHYVFSLRDFSRIIQGTLLIEQPRIDNKHIFIRVWTHEVYRVFCDRLIDDSDRSWLHNKLKVLCQQHFNEDFGAVFKDLATQSQLTADDMTSLMFGDYLRPEAEMRCYEEIKLDEFALVAKQALEEYNRTHEARMNLAIFRYMLEHLSRISRVLRQPGGNALLVGVCGSGRQSLTRLAAYMAGYDIFQPDVTKSYGEVKWRQDLKKLLMRAGKEGKTTVFLLEDSQIISESFWEDINTLLCSSDILSLFSEDEKAELIDTLRRKQDTEFSPIKLLNLITQRCRQNIHIILAMSPVGDAFRTRVRDRPSLVNLCYIDWFQVWPDDALQLVAQKFLEDDLTDKVGADIVDVCRHFHRSVCLMSERYFEEMSRHNYITPISYLELISLFNSLLKKKRSEVVRKMSRYEFGLEKLALAASQITQMKRDLEELQAQLNIAAVNSDTIMVVINKESQKESVKREIVAEEEARVNEKAAVAEALKSQCEADLAEAIPALEAAIEALNTLKPAEISLVKSMQNLPSGVKLVMSALSVMSEFKPDRKIDSAGTGRKILDYWGPAERILGDLNFLKELIEIDKEDSKGAIKSKIRKTFIPNPEVDSSRGKSASPGAEGLLEVSMEIYDRVTKAVAVAPKRINLKGAEKELRETLEILEGKRAELKEVQDRLEILTNKFRDSTLIKDSLEKNVDLCARKLGIAEKLINELGGESMRWSESASNLKMTFENLTGDMLVASGVISYLGAFTAKYRDDCIMDWIKFCQTKGIQCSQDFSLSKVLADPDKIRVWNISGLPADSFSNDNAVIVDMARRWPLMIDPQGQANNWIKNLEKENGLQVVSLEQNDLMSTLENCVQFGRPVLIENVGEEFGAFVKSIVLKQTFKQDGVQYIKLGDKAVEFSQDFKLYLTTKLPNPHYSPELQVNVSLLNFITTPEGLEDQLLGIFVAKERPELEQERNSLIVQNAENKKTLRETEDLILETLSTCGGNILEDETTIKILNSSKVLSNEIQENQKIAEGTEREINLLRETYRPVANTASILFFSIRYLSAIDPMYQYSFAWFINLFILAIKDSPKSNKLNDDLTFLTDHFTYSLYCNVCRSLFQKDKLLFSFLLCSNFMEAKGELGNEEFLFFLTGGMKSENKLPNPNSSWLSQKSWDEICYMCDLAAFNGFRSSFISKIEEWRKLYDSIEPQFTPMPAPWDTQLSDFHKMIIIRCLRPDKITSVIEYFVKSKLGDRFVQQLPFDLAECYADSNSCSPLIFLLTQGADPIPALVKFAADKGFSDKFDTVAMGQGQGHKASQMIGKAVRSGSWIVLQDCHLAVSWMPTLERLCEAMSPDTVHPDFRLWLTSYPSVKFPVTVLQNGVKITIEPPTGLRQKILQSYLSEPISNPKFFSGCPGKEDVWEKLLFSLCFFHALVQERVSFGAIGWNIPYEFNESDFRISVEQLQTFINEYSEVPFSALVYHTGELNYGGRVTDPWDRHTLLSILSLCYNREVIDNPNYKFSQSGTYHTPPKSSYEGYIEYIKGFPIAQHHEAFGMDENADILKSLLTTKTLLESVLLTQKHSLNEGIKKRNSRLQEIASHILSRMVPQFDLEVALEKYPVKYEEACNTLLVQEMKKFNKLTSVIRSTLINLQKATEGLIVMTAELSSLADSLLLGKVPTLWARNSYPSLKPLGCYVNNLLERLNFLQKWMDYGKPSTFWISGFFFPQAFLTGILQNYARKYTVPIERLKFQFKILQVDHMDSHPEDGVYIHGLYLTGARWDRKQGILEEQLPKVLYDQVPVIWMKPEQQSNVPDTSDYMCPAYKTSERRGVLSTTGHSTNFVLSVMIPTDRPESHWIIRGVAMLFQLDN